jgi:hypothetical protein
MDTDQSSLHLLSHFDQPADATVVSALPLSPVRPTRGTLWVLKWTCTAASLLYATTLMTEFAYSLAAEQILARAARAGALEATLPRATVKSVEQSVRRCLAGRIASHGELKITLFDNGAWVTKKLERRGGDRLSIALSIPARALMPSWICMLTSWRGDTKIEAHAERTMPGRQLKRGGTP